MSIVKLYIYIFIDSKHNLFFLVYTKNIKGYYMQQHRQHTQKWRTQ